MTCVAFVRSYLSRRSGSDNGETVTDGRYCGVLRQKKIVVFSLLCTVGCGEESFLLCWFAKGNVKQVTSVHCLALRSQ